MAYQQALTVMGPGADSVRGSLYAPPRLHAKTDKFVWRQSVRIWCQKLRSFAKGGDNRAKGIANSLGITLYSAMDYSFVQVVDSAIAAGDLKLVADDDDEDEVIDQKVVIEKIIDLVAKDSVTDGVRRLVKMSQDVHKCKHEKHETYENFAERFRGVAQTYLNHCYAGNTSQDSQNFAMLLLENANLPTSTFNNLVSILIADAKVKSKSTKQHFQITEVNFNAIEQSFEKPSTLGSSTTRKLVWRAKGPSPYRKLKNYGMPTNKASQTLRCTTPVRERTTGSHTRSD